MLEYIDGEIEVHDPPDFPDATVYRGHKGFLDQIDKFREVFREIEYEPTEFTPHGDQVVVVVNATGVSRSGISGEMTYAQVEDWRQGKIVRVRYFVSRDQAFEAAGLSE